MVKPLPDPVPVTYEQAKYVLEIASRFIEEIFERSESDVPEGLARENEYLKLITTEMMGLATSSTLTMVRFYEFSATQQLKDDLDL